MGFFSGLTKVLQGKPVFDPADEVARGATASAAPEQVSPAEGPKQIPVVQIRRVECHTEAADMDIFADIHNDSPQEIVLDKILLLGTKRELDTALRAGEAKQFKVYSGPRPTSQPGGYAEVQYRTLAGDYFEAVHQIRSKQEPDRTWSVTEFLLLQPIRDLR